MMICFFSSFIKPAVDFLEDNEKTKKEFLNINAKKDLIKYYEE